MDSEFVRERAATVREELPRIRRAVARSIASNAGFPVETASIRVRTRELSPAVERRCAQLVPHKPSDVVALLASEPGWLDVEDGNDYGDEDEKGRRPSTPLQMVGNVILAQMMTELTADMKDVVKSQYGDVTFNSVVEEIRGTLEAARKLDPALADDLDRKCSQQQEAKTLPTSRSLMPPMAKVIRVLTHAGKMGDGDKLVAARKLMELMELINDMGYQLDKTHLPQADTSSPRP